MVVSTILPRRGTRASSSHSRRNTPGIRYRKRVTASDPADEATGVVGDGAVPPADPAGPDDGPSLLDEATGLTRTGRSAYGADALFVGDAPPPAAAVAPPLPVSPAALDALFTEDTADDAAATATPPLTKPPATPRGPVSGDAPTSPAADAAQDAGDEPDEATALLTAGDDARWADETTPATALTWVDPNTVAAHTSTATFDDDSRTEIAGGLLRGARLRPAISRPGVLVPLGVLAGLVAAYAGTTLLWPLHEVPPTVQAVEFATVPAPAATVTWPAEGSAAIGVGGLATTASIPDAVSIASITKVVSSLMVLDRMPLAVGEQGPEFSFTRRDNLRYWDYRRDDQSALDVPVGGVLTEYQLLQGTLMGSANNYIDRLASEIWGSNAQFAEAAEVWLRDRGLSGITVVTPSGFDERNVATPEALVALGERAMQNPVFAEIVGTVSVDLPGAGTVVNTNGMLADPGVVGIKTGTLVGWNLLTAKDVTVDDSTVRLYAAVLDQPDDETRLAATRALFAQTEAALQAQEPAVAKGTVVGRVTTPWGEEVDVVAGDDAEVVLWNGAAATATTAFDLGEKRDEDATVGTLTTTGPIDATTTELVLADDVEGPSPWWRLTHPLELLGISTDR